MRDFPPRPAPAGQVCSAIDCEDQAVHIGVMHARVPGEFANKQDDLTHVHFEVPICLDHATLYRREAIGFCHMTTFEGMR